MSENVKRFYNGPQSELMDKLYDDLMEHCDITECGDWSILSLYLAREIKKIDEAAELRIQQLETANETLTKERDLWRQAHHASDKDNDEIRAENETLSRSNEELTRQVGVMNNHHLEHHEETNSKNKKIAELEALLREAYLFIGEIRKILLKSTPELADMVEMKLVEGWLLRTKKQIRAQTSGEEE